MLKTGFESRTFGVVINNSTNWATTSAQRCPDCVCCRSRAINHSINWIFSNSLEIQKTVWVSFVFSLTHTLFSFTQTHSLSLSLSRYISSATSYETSNLVRNWFVFLTKICFLLIIAPSFYAAVFYWKRPTKIFPNSVTGLGYFWKVLATNFPTKVAQIFHNLGAIL